MHGFYIGLEYVAVPSDINIVPFKFNPVPMPQVRKVGRFKDIRVLIYSQDTFGNGNACLVSRLQ